MMNPPVGLIKVNGPPCIPAKTGTPAVPIRIYVMIAKDPSRFPSMKPAKMEKKVCKETGTLVPPIGTASIGNQTVMLAPIAIKHTKSAPNVRSIGFIFLK